MFGKDKEEGQEEQSLGSKAVVTIKFLADKDKLKKLAALIGEVEEGLGGAGSPEPRKP